MVEHLLNPLDIPRRSVNSGALENIRHRFRCNGPVQAIFNQHQTFLVSLYNSTGFIDVIPSHWSAYKVHLQAQPSPCVAQVG